MKIFKDSHNKKVRNLNFLSLKKATNKDIKIFEKDRVILNKNSKEVKEYKIVKLDTLDSKKITEIIKGGTLGAIIGSVAGISGGILGGIVGAIGIGVAGAALSFIGAAYIGDKFSIPTEPVNRLGFALWSGLIGGVSGIIGGAVLGSVGGPLGAVVGALGGAVVGSKLYHKDEIPSYPGAF